MCGDDGFYDDLNMDEIDLGIENYEELFGVALDNPENLFGDGIDGIFGTEDMSVSNCQGAYAAEVFPGMKFLKVILSLLLHMALLPFNSRR